MDPNNMDPNDFEPLTDLELDDLLREWRIPDAPAGLRKAVFTRPGFRSIPIWQGVAAACCLAAIAGGVWWRSAKPPSPLPLSRSANNQPFIEIPYTVPLNRNESATVVRMNIRVASLIAAGYKIEAVDPAAILVADVLVGEDGRAHAVRLVSGANSSVSQ